MTEWLVRSSPDRVEWVQVAAGDMALCSQARHSAQALKWPLQITSVINRGGKFLKKLYMWCCVGGE